MFRVLSKNLPTILNNSNKLNNIKGTLVLCNNYSTSGSNNTTVAEPHIVERVVGVAAPNKRATPPKVPKRRPDKIRSVYYPEYEGIPRVAAKGFFRITSRGFDYYFLDVRSVENFQKESIVGAVNHPVEKLEESCKDLDKNTLVVVYGEKERGWPQACAGALILQKKGFKNVLALESSIPELVEKGFFYNSEVDSYVQ
ncbi:hypothetical protein DICPUDRAFT_156705 [Dictyostelium purpureum]|uniref:Rhodanese domain-containing protein n=1 Tax=Dictyostelium purpureum TaxID=5786 RepID=F0ZX76_DICPU|nr:uncharacterized protein DICPUDRAFT_156705 [Dictyostelium purpureum]EGC31449.1 hypothetical protein DICPUDRAFT_156705 [Dictyostelium purpureum]|eukprot:XP_003292018.1 hypothetical protein DICPUDRAFT_156705 [Dictyostelium purpureum]